MKTITEEIIIKRCPICNDIMCYGYIDISDEDIQDIEWINIFVFY